MNGFEPRTSSFVSDRSSSWATPLPGIAQFNTWNIPKQYLSQGSRQAPSMFGFNSEQSDSYD